MLETRNNHRTADPVLEQTSTNAAPATPRRRRGVFDEISAGDAVFLGLFWLFGTVLLSAIAPAPDPTAAQAPLNVALNVAWNIGFIAALGGAATRRRLALVGSVVAGGAMAVMATFCGLEGHTGLWIPTQFVLGFGIVAFAVNRLRG